MNISPRILSEILLKDKTSVQEFLFLQKRFNDFIFLESTKTKEISPFAFSPFKTILYIFSKSFLSILFLVRLAISSIVEKYKKLTRLYYPIKSFNVKQTINNPALLALLSFFRSPRKVLYETQALSEILDALIYYQ